MNRRTKLALARDKNIKAQHAGKRISAEGNVYYENRPNRTDLNRTKKFGKGGDLWTPLDFTSIEEYFDYINDSLINGNRTQVKELYNDMDESQKRQFFRYANMQEGMFDEVVDYINENVRKYAKGGVLDEKESMLHFVLNQLPSGTVANMSSYSDYKTIDKIKSQIINILQEEGDVKYSIYNLKSLIKRAEQEIEEPADRSYMNTEVGKVDVYSGMSKFKNDAVVYHALSTEGGMNRSVFWIVNKSDADKLENIGYDITKVNVKKGEKPYALTDGEIGSKPDYYAKGGGVTNVTKNILKQYVFEYHYPKYKRQPETTQKYKVDISKVIPIGGMGEDGFKLITLDGNDTGVVITLVKALQAIRKGEIEFEQSKDYFVKVKAIKNNEYAKGGGLNDSHLDDLYNKSNQNVYGALELYAGELGIYNMFYGHKVDASKKAKYKRAQKYLESKYMAKGGELSRQELLEHYDNYVDNISDDEEPISFELWKQEYADDLNTIMDNGYKKGGKLKTTKYIVFYVSEEGQMRERLFGEDEKELADDFSKKVNGSVAPIKLSKGGKVGVSKGSSGTKGKFIWIERQSGFSNNIYSQGSFEEVYNELKNNKDYTLENDGNDGKVFVRNSDGHRVIFSLKEIYSKGGAVKQKSAQYKIDGYGSGDRKRKAKPVGFRYERIRDPKTGKLKVVTKKDKQYYATPTQKEIKAYKDGDVTARKMLGFENRADHSDKEPVRFSRQFAKGGSVTIDGQKAMYKVKYSLDGEKPKVGYVVRVLNEDNKTVSHWLLYNNKKELVKELSLQESHEMVKNDKLVLAKKYDIDSDYKKEVDPETEVKDMSYSERQEWIKENLIPKIKSAKTEWRSSDGGNTYDMNDKDSTEKFIQDARNAADYSSTENFESSTSLITDNGHSLESTDGEEFDKVVHDNTYNTSYLGLLDWDFNVFNIYDSRFVLAARPHLGGDVRGNYGDAIYFEDKSKEDVLMKFYEAVVDGNRTVHIDFKDGTSVVFDAQQNGDVNYYELYEDGSKKKIKLGSPAEILTTTFKTFGGWKGDDFVEEIVDEFERSKDKNKKKMSNGGGVDSSDNSNYAIIAYNKAKLGTTQNKGFQDAVNTAKTFNAGSELGNNLIIVKGNLLWTNARVKGVELENGEKIYYGEYQHEYFTENQLDYLRGIMVEENGDNYNKFDFSKLNQMKNGGGLRKFQEDDFVIGIAKNKYYGDKGQIFGYTDQTGNPIAKGLVVVRMLDNSGLKYIPETDLDFYNPKGVPLSEKNKARLKELFPNEPHNLPRYQEEYEARSSKGKMSNGGELPSSMIGKSLSSGTLKSEHLIESFMGFLQSVKVELGIEEKVNNLQEEVNALEKDEDGDFVGESEETATYILNEDIFDLLNNIAPEGTSFGSHEGNGSDFGFWEYENEEEFAKGGGVSDTKKIKKRLEYLRKEIRAERISQGELIELESLAKYIDKGDVELLEAAGVPEFDDEEFAKGGSLKKTKAQYVELLNEIGVPEHDHPEYGGRVPYKHLNTYGLWLRKNDPIAFNVGYSDWASEDDYKKGGAIKQRGEQYHDRDVEKYGNRDTSVRARPVGYRYRKIVDKKTGRLRTIEKTDKEYYKPVTQKDIQAYEEGDKSARRRIYREVRKDHSDKNPKNKRAY